MNSDEKTFYKLYEKLYYELNESLNRQLHEQVPNLKFDNLWRKLLHSSDGYVQVVTKFKNT